MKLSAEMSLYPLQEEYEKPILEFIEDLRSNPELSVKVNTMSTQVFGDFDVVMGELKKAMKKAFGQELARILVVKFINSDLNPE
jgi:uncharacterized protein YqgV (UPF0045/DUF77 family)